MVCENCHTTLPDEALACWKCGTPTPSASAANASKTRGVNLALAILTFFISAALFVCAGWSVPFMVAGNIMSFANRTPEWMSLADLLGEISFVLTALVFFGGVWWIAYWMLTRMLAKPG